MGMLQSNAAVDIGVPFVEGTRFGVVFDGEPNSWGRGGGCRDTHMY